ncbi:uncharacterized protein LOC135219387 [Macrobrachium nipponense]|uniref:uncharacterized protein LOC135219387 n=1 Tax=Macrobrachium nipponense TaxID=159736 RepID=UPI0030C7C192
MLTPMLALLSLLTIHQISKCAAQVLITRTEPLSYVPGVHEVYSGDGKNKDHKKESSTINTSSKFITTSSITEENSLENAFSTSTLREGMHAMSSTVVRVTGVDITSSADLRELGLKYIPSILLAEARLHTTAALGEKTRTISTISFGNGLQTLSIQSSRNQTPWVSSTQSLGYQTSRVSPTQSLGYQTSRAPSSQSLGYQTSRVSSTQSLGNQTQKFSATQSLRSQTPKNSAAQSLDVPTLKVPSPQNFGNQTLTTDRSRSAPRDNEQFKPNLISEQSATSSENSMNVLSAILSPFLGPRNDPKAQTDTSRELKNTTEVQNSNESEGSLTSEASYFGYSVGSVMNSNNNIPQNNDSNCGHDNEASQCDTDDENVMKSSTVDERYVFTGSSESTTASFPYLPDTNNSRPESKNNTESIKVPFCCFDRQIKNHCSHFRQQNLALPVAEDHCKHPTLKNVSVTPRRTLNCSTNNRIKISLNTENKVISSSAEMALFGFNHWFISEFCVEADPDVANQWWAVVCALDVDQEQEDTCPENKCFQKCCPAGHALKNDSCVCHVGKSILSEIADAPLANASGRHHGFQFSRFGMPRCKEPTVSYLLELIGGKKDLDAARRNIIREQSPSRQWPCIDDSLDELENVTRLVMISCREPKDGTWKTLRNVLIPAGLIVSCVFLLCTLTCHLCVAPLRDLHGLCLAAYMGALLVGDASLFTIKMYSSVLSETACLAMGTIIHVSFLSTFMWLNVVCIDIWNYVGQTVQAVPLYRNPSNLRWFIVYGLYAWGCPIIFGGVIGGLQANPANHNLSFLPDFAGNSCWFNGDDFWETLLFFYGPIGIMFIVNAYFIVHTGMRLYCLHYCCCFRSLSCCYIPSPYNSHQQPPLHRTYLNEFWERFSLFALLVFCWGTEFISWLSGSGDSEIWGLTDTINAFQGFFIFLIFLRSTKKRRLLKSSIDKWLNNFSKRRLAFCKRMSFPQSMPVRHLVANLRKTVAAKKPLTSGILKDTLTETTSIDNIICDEVTKSCDSKPEDDVGNPEVTLQNPSQVWTVIPQWKSLKSRSYFLHNVSAGHSNDSSNRTFENLGDLQNIYLPREGEERNLENHSDRKSSCERNSFDGWTLMKARTGSVSLKDGRHCWDAKGDVVCQALTKKDSK